MKVTVVPCGPAANESELKAVARLKSHLISIAGDEEWVLLTNLAFSVTHQLQSDEIDIVAIGPPGVRVIEVKHWADRPLELAEQEAERVTNKARKIGTTLRKIVPDLPYVKGAFLLTQESPKLRRLAGTTVRAVQFNTLKNWKAAIGFDSQSVLSPQQVTRLARFLEPKSAVALDGSLRRLAGYVNLELQTPKDQRFHRIYKGIHPVRQDRVILHLYDLSASNETNAETKARREYEALHRLQLYAWAPRIYLESFQAVPGYTDEMFFFTVLDPAAPCIEERTSDVSWETKARLVFAQRAMGALGELHEAETGDAPMVHRNLTPKTILVKHDNSPILTGFELTKIPADRSVASAAAPTGEWETAAAPEVRASGLGVADHRSDVYSLCACLIALFQGRDDEKSQQATETLNTGLKEEPEARASLQDLELSLSKLLDESTSPPAPPPARFWTEEQLVRFQGRDYRIVTRLGSGGIGTAFKVVEIDRSTKEDLGTYVAKVGHNAETGERVLKAYSLARSHLGQHAALSTIFETALEWREDNFIALMSWVKGAPLHDFTGVFTLLAEDHRESGEALAVRWLCTMCEALDVLHSNGLVHGDISPRNMIISGGDLVLTDYDFVAKIGEPVTAPATVLYCSPSYQDKRPASPADDIYALAASFFHVVFDKQPFHYNGVHAKERGLNWEGVDRTEYPPFLVNFLNRATHPDPEQRFGSVADALAALKEAQTETEDEEQPQEPQQSMSPSSEVAAGPRVERRENEVAWLRSLLQSYPGSRWGNRETRGLDSEFAAQTYVETALEKTLYDEIRNRQVRLVILCGNAGDGKTALLQHLAGRLGLGKHASSERVLEGQLDGGPLVRMNLDGSAAWQGRSADELLDEFLEPFQEGPPSEDIVHLLAINDGRLLEWTEETETGRLADELYDLLMNDPDNLPSGGDEAGVRESYLRFISLNQRSLVGGIRPDRKGIDISFLERLLDQLYRGEQASEIWEPCQTCSAQERCEVLRATRIFGPDGLPGMADKAVRSRARQRLFEALQAVHLRGETHITARELRAALVYILFGIHFCQDYHSGSEAPTAYWDRAFFPASSGRQGEVLRELVRFDPALESHPQIDRHLLRASSPDSRAIAPHYADLSRESARRRAYFEWTEEHIEKSAGEPQALGLAQGGHLQLFRDLPLEKDPQELAKLRDRLCDGISRLEDLPPQALDRPGMQLRITSRTPTETVFWVEKSLDAFRLEAELPSETAGLDRLHRQAVLIYDGTKERLRLGAELFHLLLELSDGYQLGDVSTDDIFTQLSIFVQRLVREDDSHIFAWNPMQDESIYEVSAKIERTESGALQPIIIRQLDRETG